MGEGPRRTWEEPLGPGAASRPRRLDREGTVVKRTNFSGKKEVAREEDQHRGAYVDPVHSLTLAKTACCVAGVKRQLLGGAEW